MKNIEKKKKILGSLQPTTTPDWGRPCQFRPQGEYKKMKNPRDVIGCLIPKEIQKSNV
jgi:hypothetical protein